MILQALVQHYEDLAARGEIAQPGWGPVKVSYALCLSAEGEIEQVISLKTEQQKGKKAIVRPQEMQVPAQVKRSSGVRANFLCDNSSYILGSSGKGKPERDFNCFQACGALHYELLKDVKHAAAAALLLFFENWEPEKAKTCSVLQANSDDIFGGANFVFRHGGMYLHEIPEIRDAWQRHYDGVGTGAQKVCLVTGKMAPAAQLHPLIKGIRGAQTSGASLVSYNAPSFCSYDKEQGMNAPTSEYAAFAYGAALNHLIADSRHVHYIGDTALLCWAKGGQLEYQDIFGDLLCEDETYSEQDYQVMAKDIAAGRPFVFQENTVDPNCPFYVLGIAPNAARLSVRFFLQSTFGEMLQNILEHQERLNIVRPSFDNHETISLWRLLNETVNQRAKDKSASPLLAGELLRAILSNSYYPALLLQGITLRIRAEREVTRGRAAIIKAYYLKNKHPDVTEEVLTVSLNPNSTNVPYNLGRLFSVLEDIQSKASPGINTTVRDRYFNSASATPAQVFPVLINLAQKHMKKLSTGQRIHYEKQMEEIMEKLDTAFPSRMTLPQQGAFQLGYYHQTQARYAGKKTEGTENE